MQDSTAAENGGRFSALARPLYRRYWLGSFASIGATQLQTMGQGWLVFELSGSTVDLGLLGASASIPAIVVSLFGGAVADRLDKRLVIMVSSVLTGSLLLLLGLLDLTGLVEVWHVLVIAALIALLSGLEWPTRQAYFTALIERRDMMSAVALNSIIWQSCRMMMPAFGGILIALADTWLVFVLCGAGFYAMFVVMWSIRVSVPPPQNLDSTLQSVMEGFRFILGNPVFAILIGLSFTSMFFGNSYHQLLPAFSSLLGVAETGYGFLISATGLGSVLGTLIVGSWQQSRHLGMVMLLGSATAASSLYLFTTVTAFADQLSHAYILAIIAVFVFSVFSSIYMISSMTVMQLQVPDHLRGRVMGIHGITYSLMPLGGLLTGTVAAASSPPAAVTLATSCYLAAVLFILWRRPVIRRLDGERLARDSQG